MGKRGRPVRARASGLSGSPDGRRRSLAPPLTRDASSLYIERRLLLLARPRRGCFVRRFAGWGTDMVGWRAFTLNLIATLDCGHIKVAADGTAYVPSKGCGGQQAVVVSENNGLTWDVRKVPGSTEGETDPSVGIGTDGTIYFAYANGDGTKRVGFT